MALYFLDTSAVAKRYLAEVGSGWITSLTDPLAGNFCWIAEITPVELVAALYRRARSGGLTLVQAQQQAHIFRHELSSHYQQIALAPSICNEAMRLVTIYPLRAYDAMQLASALFLQNQRQALGGLPALTFISGDQDLNRAAVAEGLLADDPNLHP